MSNVMCTTSFWINLPQVRSVKILGIHTFPCVPIQHKHRVHAGLELRNLKVNLQTLSCRNGSNTHKSVGSFVSIR